MTETTKTTHTPGPWQVRESEFYPCEIHAVAGKHIANVFGTDFPDGEANARLIAAAPELLAAPKLAEAYLRENSPRGSIREIFHKLNTYGNGVMKPVRAAIAKAERVDE